MKFGAKLLAIISFWQFLFMELRKKSDFEKNAEKHKKIKISFCIFYFPIINFSSKKLIIFSTFDCKEEFQ